MKVDESEAVRTQGLDDAEGLDGASVEVRVPASTSNLGAGFDCFGLALGLYLTVRARIADGDDGAGAPVVVSCEGEGGADELPRSEDNLIFRAMRLAAGREGWTLPPVRLDVTNEIPLGRGLGSSAAAVVAGLALAASLCGRALEDGALLRYATELEGHADNAAASLRGGWVTTCVKSDGEVLVARRRWPLEVKVVVVSPSVSLETSRARAALPETVAREDAVYNLQRAALFGAALEAGDDPLVWEAMRDRLHQPHRRGLVPGLAAALDTPRQTGLVGLALSGAGPSVVALARARFEEIGEAVAAGFRGAGVAAEARVLEVDEEGLRVGRAVQGVLNKQEE